MEKSRGYHRNLILKIFFIIFSSRFYCLRIDVENYYPQYPQKPFWINKLTDELGKLKPKRLPLSDINSYDLFKKYFGYKKATKFKVWTHAPSFYPYKL
jgi:hypothetical protein